MFESGTIVGRHYKIISRAGQGGMGFVFKALDLNLHRDVALKFLNVEAAREESAVQRFLHEGRVLATLKHPNVVVVFASDVDEQSKLPFLVMEYIQGNRLDQMLPQYRTDPGLALVHILELLDGIHACHLKGIIHRDLKPSNVLINQDGCLKIVDFGIAKTSAAKHTKTGAVIGTPQYMSPEQAFGHTLSGSSDVYSIGILLWEALTGRPPFDLEGEAENPHLAIMLMHVRNPVPMGELSRHGPAKPFAELLAKMLEKEPEKRPEIPDIQKVISDKLTQLYPTRASRTPLRPPSIEATIPSPPRSPAKLAILFAAFLAMVLGAWVALKGPFPMAAPTTIPDHSDPKPDKPLPTGTVLPTGLPATTSGPSLPSAASTPVSSIPMKTVTAIATSETLVHGTHEPPEQMATATSTGPVGTLGTASMKASSSLEIPPPQPTVTSPALPVAAPSPAPSPISPSKPPIDPFNIDLGGGVGIQFARIPSGTFQMGAGPMEKPENDENPSRQIRISDPSLLGRYEVTHDQYLRVIGYRHSSFKPRSERRPVGPISWLGAVMFCNALSEKCGLRKCYTVYGETAFGDFTADGFRLPTEAEWEYSCRAGSTSSFFWGNTMDQRYGWTKENAGGALHDVGTRLPNAWGLYDMVGNADEWCHDWYGPYDAKITIDPDGPVTGDDRVLRGGAIVDSGKFFRSAHRDYGNPTSQKYYHGFRVTRRCPPDVIATGPLPTPVVPAIQPPEPVQKTPKKTKGEKPSSGGESKKKKTVKEKKERVPSENSQEEPANSETPENSEESPATPSDEDAPL